MDSNYSCFYPEIFGATMKKNDVILILLQNETKRNEILRKLCCSFSFTFAQNRINFLSNSNYLVNSIKIIESNKEKAAKRNKTERKRNLHSCK